MDEIKRNAKAKQKQTNRRLKRRAQASGKRDFKNQKHVDILAFNVGAETHFIELVRLMIEKNEGKAISVARVIQKASFKLNVSQQTAKRYLLKHSDDEAELTVFGDLVLLNGNYQPDYSDLPPRAGYDPARRARRNYPEDIDESG